MGGLEDLIVTDATNLERRLAAVAFADVASFSRHLAQNEVETLRQWKVLRSEIIEPYTVQQKGRVVEMSGDALLVEFSSVVNAVRWAMDVQRTAHAKQLRQDGFFLSLRIGINIEDVIVDEGTLQGNGVNIAARIHQAAQPGQVVVTSLVKDLVENRLPMTLHDLGTPPLKNIIRVTRVFAVDWSEEAEREAASQPYLQWATRPTVAVLPFRAFGKTEDDGYFGDGITEDIITGLSRSRAFFVIARTSTLRYRERGKDLRAIAEELDVRYILDGSLRRLSDRLRINAELIDVTSNRPIWSQRFDGVADDVFEFQDQIVTSIVGSIEPQLRAAEIARIKGRPTESLDAYDCVLKAISLLYAFTDESFEQTEILLERAVQIDPRYAQGHAYLAWRLVFVLAEERSSDFRTDTANALASARRAMEYDPDDAFTLVVAGHLLTIGERTPEEAVDLFERALELNENSAFAWGLSASTYSFLGRGDEARERLRNVWRLSPFDPLNFFYWTVAGLAEFVEGRDEEAIAWLRKSKRANPRFIACLRILAAALALAGEKAEAEKVGKEILAVTPSFRISSFLKWYPMKRPEDVKRLRKRAESSEASRLG